MASSSSGPAVAASSGSSAVAESQEQRVPYRNGHGISWADVSAGLKVTAKWESHNHALKYFREVLYASGRKFIDFPMDAPVAVVQVLPAEKGKAFRFGEIYEWWDWRQMVLMLSQTDIQAIFSVPVIHVGVERREGSCDHSYTTACNEINGPLAVAGWARLQLPRLPCHTGTGVPEVVDFVFERKDGTKVWLHPRRKGGHDLVKTRPGAAPVMVMPRSGPGCSDGRGTFKRMMHSAYSDDAFEQTVVTAPQLEQTVVTAPQQEVRWISAADWAVATDPKPRQAVEAAQRPPQPKPTVRVPPPPPPPRPPVKVPPPQQSPAMPSPPQPPETSSSASSAKPAPVPFPVEPAVAAKSAKPPPPQPADAPQPPPPATEQMPKKPPPSFPTDAPKKPPPPQLPAGISMPKHLQRIDELSELTHEPAVADPALHATHGPAVAAKPTPPIRAPAVASSAVQAVLAGSAMQTALQDRAPLQPCPRVRVVIADGPDVQVKPKAAQIKPQQPNILRVKEPPVWLRPLQPATAAVAASSTDDGIGRGCGLESSTDDGIGRACGEQPQTDGRGCGERPQTFYSSASQGKFSL